MTTKKKTGSKPATKPSTKPRGKPGPKRAPTPASRAGKAKAIPRPAAPKDPAPAHTAAPRGKADPAAPSSLDSAAMVLADAPKEGLSAKAIVEAMATKGLWTSPGGKTPEATVYAGMLREIGRKGKAARFRKVSRGRFALAATATA